MKQNFLLKTLLILSFLGIISFFLYNKFFDTSKNDIEKTDSKREIPVASSDNVTQIAESCNAFSCNLYSQLKQEDGNLFFSPFSISTALEMAYAGARGITEKEMAQVLHNTLSQEQLHPAYANLIQTLNNEQNDSYELSVANKLFIQKNFKLLPSFETIIKTNYTDALGFVDFVNNPQAAVDTVNNWVSLKTKEKIKDIISTKDIDDLTRLVIANAIYFKGKWEKPFDTKSTKISTFHVDNKNNVEVNTMRKKEKYNYMENDSLKMLELYYKEKNLSMVIILPNEIDGLQDIEKNITSETLTNWMSQLQSKKVTVEIPKFEIETSYHLKDNLKKMGMPSAFSGSANFKGMAQEPLYISKVIHKAFIKTDEEGTEAAAATVIIMAKFAMREEPKTFIADHPFIFLIKDNQTDLILFMGRLAKP